MTHSITAQSIDSRDPGAGRITTSVAANGTPTGVRSSLWRRFVSRARATRNLIRTIHRVIGAPDYEGYVRHHDRCHPGLPPLDHDEFVRQRLEARYSRPGARCC